MLKGERKHRYSDTILSVSAIIIAVASIFISVWQGLETRKHNRLSVRPKLEIYFTSSGNSCGFMLVNSGLGPAMITERNIFVNDSLRNDLSIGDIPSLFNLPNVLLSFGPTGQGASLLAGERRDVIIFSNLDREMQHMLLDNIPRKLNFRIRYKSMYDEFFTCSTQKK